MSVNTFAPGAVISGAIAQIKHLVGRRLEIEPCRQRCRQEQPGVGHRMTVVEGQVKPVDDVGEGHRKGDLCVEGAECVATPILSTAVAPFRFHAALRYYLIRSMTVDPGLRQPA